MTRDPWDRRRRIQLVSAVVIVAIIASLAVAVALVYMGHTRWRF